MKLRSDKQTEGQADRAKSIKQCKLVFYFGILSYITNIEVIRYVPAKVHPVFFFHLFPLSVWCSEWCHEKI